LFEIQQVRSTQYKGAQQYKDMWQHIQEYIDAQISRLMDNLYQKLNKKLDALINQTRTKREKKFTHQQQVSTEQRPTHT